MESQQDMQVRRAYSEPGTKSSHLRLSTEFLSRASFKIPVSVWVFVDSLIAVFSMSLAYEWSPQAGEFKVTPTEWVAFAGAVVLAGLVRGVYERITTINGWRLFSMHLQRAVLAGLFLGIVLNVIIFGQHGHLTGRWVLALAAFIFFLVSFFPRFVLVKVLASYPIRVLFVGDDSLSSALFKRLEQEQPQYKLVGSCTSQPEEGKEYLGGIEDVAKVCREEKIDEIVIGNKSTNNPEILKQCFHTAPLGCKLLDECSFCEEVFNQVPVDHIDDSWFFSSRINMSRRFGLLLKRLVDIIFALTGIVVLSPVFVLIWLVIRLTSWGPALYKQKRCGQYGTLFTIYKFRTMVMDAESKGEQWTTKGDPRITPVGYFLRKTRLDEVPQLLNVLKGNMSLVGPRPERPELAKRIEKEVPYFSLRLWARPGLTGLAQVRYRYGASIEDARAKLQYDLYYIKNWSPFLDIQIFCRTFMTMMKGAQ